MCDRSHGLLCTKKAHPGKESSPRSSSHSQEDTIQNHCPRGQRWSHSAYTESWDIPPPSGEGRKQLITNSKSEHSSGSGLMGLSLLPTWGLPPLRKASAFGLQFPWRSEVTLSCTTYHMTTVENFTGNAWKMNVRNLIFLI